MIHIGFCQRVADHIMRSRDLFFLIDIGKSRREREVGLHLEGKAVTRKG